MNEKKIKHEKKKKNMMIRFMEWIIKGQKKAAEKGDICSS